MVALVGAVLATLVVGRLLHLRVLVPSWRFFDRADAPPTLWIARAGGDWELVGPPRRHPLVGWAFAPARNLGLAYQAAVDRLVAEVSALDPELPDDAPAITSLATYATVAAIAREAGGARWKIVSEDTDFLTSRERAA